MILKVEALHTVGGKIGTYKVIHDSGIIRKYKAGKLPKTVEQFCEDHVAFRKHINGFTVKIVYVYDDCYTYG